jgi:hypothetical protein
MEGGAEMNELNELISYLGIAPVIMASFCFLFFFLLTLLENAFSFWSLVVIAVIICFLTANDYLSWDIFQYILLFGFSALAGWLIGGMLLFLYGIVRITTGISNKINSWID